MDIKKLNEEKFLNLSKLKLPIRQYAITGSGPIGIRNIRAINDIDIIVSNELWDTLAKQYGIIETKEIRKIELPYGIEAFGEESFLTYKNKDDPTIPERIDQAEVIHELPFESLEHCKYFKKRMGREKDLNDIKLIEQWQNSNFDLRN